MVAASAAVQLVVASGTDCRLGHSAWEMVVVVVEQSPCLVLVVASGKVVVAAGSRSLVGIVAASWAALP